MEHSAPPILFHSPSSPSKGIEFEPVSIPDDKLHEIVRQFTNVQELADLQADIFGCSSQNLHDCPPTLTLPSFLEPIASERSTRKRKLSSSSSSSSPPLPARHLSSSTVIVPSSNKKQLVSSDSVAKRRKAAADSSIAYTDDDYKPSSYIAANDASSGGGGGGTNSAPSSNTKMNHNRSERERRQKINESIDQLRLLLPPQCQEVAGNKLAILQESVGYMRHLKDSLSGIQAERQRSDEAYRRLWEEYRHLRHYLSLYSYPDPHHVHHCVLPPFHAPSSAAAAAAGGAGAMPMSPSMLDPLGVPPPPPPPLSASISPPADYAPLAYPYASPPSSTMACSQCTGGSCPGASAHYAPAPSPAKQQL